MATKPLIGLVALLGLGGAGYAAWAFSGRGGDDRPGEVAAASPAPAPPAADDATLIASQGNCPVMPDTKLGDMGAPVKLMLKGKDGADEPVFVCCKGCKRKALADPDKTLARAAELRAATR